MDVTAVLGHKLAYLSRLSQSSLAKVQHMVVCSGCKPQPQLRQHIGIAGGQPEVEGLGCGLVLAAGNCIMHDAGCMWDGGRYATEWAYVQD